MKLQALTTRLLSFCLCVFLSACALTPLDTPERSPYAAMPEANPYETHTASPTKQPYPAASATYPITSQAQTNPATHPQEIRVALLLPLTGKSAELGQAMLDAAMLGLFDKYAALPKDDASPRIMILPKDTGDEPKQAAKAAEEAIGEGAQLILGPLFSDGVSAVKPIAKAHHINVISFSNNRSVAGDNSYLFGFLPEEQVNRVVATAVEKGQQHIGALLPANDYGIVLADTLKDYAAVHGVMLAGIVRYPPDAADITPYIQQLKTGSDGNPQPIDALLLAEGGESFLKLVDNLKRYQLGNDQVRYLGTGLWDERTLLGNPALYGSWFASSPLASYSGFVSRFEAANHYTPPRLASLGYDAVALAATLAQGGGFDAAHITRASGFEGPANGIFRFHADGTIERGLSVLALTPDGKAEISVAPRMFY